MSTDFLVSIIIPAYNAHKTIAACIDSVRSQTYKNIEIIVVDDGSTDNTAQLLKTSYPDIQCISIPHSGSPGYARNRGIERATGLYIGFIDADDYWDTAVIDELLKGFEKNPNAMLSYGTLNYDGGAHDGENVHTFRTPYEGYVFTKLLRKNFIQMHPVLIKRSILQITGSFDESLNVDIAEDYDLWLRIAYRYQVVFCPAARGFYRIAENSQFHKITLIKRNQDILKVMLKMKRMFRVRHPELYKRMAVLYETLGRHYLANQQFFSSLFSYLLCVWYGIAFLTTQSQNIEPSKNTQDNPINPSDGR